MPHMPELHLDYSRHDGVGLAGLVARGEVSPVELVDAAIAAIERHNGALNAVVFKAYEEARRTAAGALPDGPFKGVPFLIKDLRRRVAGWPCSAGRQVAQARPAARARRVAGCRCGAGSMFAQAGPAAHDSVLVQRHRAAGLVLLGTTNTPELGI